MTFILLYKVLWTPTVELTDIDPGKTYLSIILSFFFPILGAVLNRK